MKKNTWDIIVDSATAALKIQLEDGSMPAGHNGPHGDSETPVRNTSHWLITFLKVYQITGKNNYKNAAKKAADYLISKKARPMDASFWHRTNPNKDFCNGLIGQAWTIEALALAADILNDSRYRDVACDVFLMHPFDESLMLWKILNVEGSYAGIDITFNHQLWFAASASILLRHEADQRISDCIFKFMNNIFKILRWNKDYLIQHKVNFDLNLKEKTTSSLRTLLGRDKAYRSDQYIREIGYHSFCLYGFAILFNELPNLEFWFQSRTKKFLFGSLSYIFSENYLKNINKNKYSYHYNTTGFENAYALYKFSSLLDSETQENIEELLTAQLMNHYDKESHLMNKNTVDNNTLAARLYELTRLPNYKIEIN